MLPLYSRRYVYILLYVLGRRYFLNIYTLTIRWGVMLQLYARRYD
jgi:hypothetical protein